MTPAQAIAMLDRQIARNGQTVLLHRQDDADDAAGVPLRALVRGYRPDELSGGVQQGTSQAVLSPTALTQAGIKLPLARLDAITFAGRRRNIEVADPISVDDTVVRINLWVTG
ncbi:hypothetical protein [Methylobacterium sp. sgz302541]|uniref:hypothetical protein n=1 Tax=unclassified Methylobacterium TaxID=2615210 RepID=UPI003D3441B0